MKLIFFHRRAVFSEKNTLASHEQRIDELFSCWASGAKGCFLKKCLHPLSSFFPHTFLLWLRAYKRAAGAVAAASAVFKESRKPSHSSAASVLEELLNNSGVR